MFHFHLTRHREKCSRRIDRDFLFAATLFTFCVPTASELISGKCLLVAARTRWFILWLRLPLPPTRTSGEHLTRESPGEFSCRVAFKEIIIIIIASFSLRLAVLAMNFPGNIVALCASIYSHLQPQITRHQRRNHASLYLQSRDKSSRVTNNFRARYRLIRESISSRYLFVRARCIGQLREQKRKFDPVSFFAYRMRVN